MYSSFRTSPASNRQHTSVINGVNTVGHGGIHYGWTHSLGRHSSEGIYAKPVAVSPIQAQPVNYPSHYHQPQQSQSNHDGIYRTSSVAGFDRKLGNGFNTLPSSLYRGVRLYDPLNNVTRFSRRSDSVETGSLNNFDFYRSQQQQQSPSGSGAPPSPTTDYEDSDTMSYQHSKLAAPEHPAMTRGKPPPENKPSLLLSADENRSIFEILGRGRQVNIVIIFLLQFIQFNFS